MVNIPQSVNGHTKDTTELATYHVKNNHKPDISVIPIEIRVQPGVDTVNNRDKLENSQIAIMTHKAVPIDQLEYNCSESFRIDCSDGTNINEDSGYEDDNLANSPQSVTEYTNKTAENIYDDTGEKKNICEIFAPRRAGLLNFFSQHDLTAQYTKFQT